MRYKCGCPEWDERPCDNLNEDVECRDCQYAEREDDDD